MERYSLDTADLLVWQQIAARDAVRAKVAERAGDVETLLGTTADGTQLLLFSVASLIAGIAKAESLADVKAAAAQFTPMSASFLGRVNTGEVVLPFMVKGLDNVIGDIESLSTTVSEAMIEVAYGEGSGGNVLSLIHISEPTRPY